MMSVLSVPIMINAGTPTLITVDMAFRINAYGDYGVANALGVISYLVTGLVAWIYLRHGMRQGRRRVSGGARAWRWLPRGLMLGLLVFVVFGPLLNLLPLGGRRELVFPAQAAAPVRLQLLGQGLRAARRRPGTRSATASPSRC